MKYGFYVSNNASRLKLFLSDVGADVADIAFILIDNTKNSGLNRLCANLKIPFYQYSYAALGLKAYQQNEFISVEFLRLLDASGSEYGFVFGGRILSGDLLQKYANKLINFHPSLLPAYPGFLAIDRALADNALLLGNTAHFVNAGVDAGPVIMQSILPRSHYKDYDSVLNLQVTMLKQIIVWLKQRRIVCENGKCEIADAVYEIEMFIPNLENTLTSDIRNAR